MLLHGHTRDTLEGMSFHDKLLIMQHCASGMVGPTSHALHTFRIMDRIRSLQGTVLSFGGKKSTRGLNLYDEFPELADLLGKGRAARGLATLEPENVMAMMGRLMSRYEEDD